MGESRTELLQWVNDLLQINYTKIEQMGTGGAYCQIIDSIYGSSCFNIVCQDIVTIDLLYAPVSHSFLPLSGDVPMGRVKLNAKHEYEYLANFKILQNLFKAHKIDKVSGRVVRKNRCLISLF